MLKTKKFRRLLAGLLAVLMLSICIPAMAFAEDGKDTKAAVTYLTVTFTDVDTGKPVGKEMISPYKFKVGSTYSYYGAEGAPALNETFPLPTDYELVESNPTITVPADGKVEFKVKNVNAGAEEPEEPEVTATAITVVFTDVDTGNPVGNEITSSVKFIVGTSYPYYGGEGKPALNEMFPVPTDYELVDSNPVITVPADGKVELKVKNVNAGAEEPEEPEVTATAITVVFTDVDTGNPVGNEITSSVKFIVGTSYPYYGGEGKPALNEMFPVPTDYELVDSNPVITVPADGKVELKVKSVNSDAEEPEEPEKVSTYVTFQFYENGEFRNQTKSSHPYYVGETYGASFIIPMLKGYETIDPNFTFTVDSENAKIQVPVKKVGAGEEEKVSTFVTFNFVDENGEFLNATESSYPYYVGETYAASFVIPMLKGFETIDPNFTFTVDKEDADITVPVKWIEEGEEEKVSTFVTFNFYDENDQFLNATESSYPYYVGETYGASFVMPMLKGYDVVDPDWTFTVDKENAEIKVVVKTHDYTITIERSNGADAVVVPIVKGVNLMAALNTDEVMAKVMDGCDGYKFTSFTYKDGSKIADEDVVADDVIVRANLEAVAAQGTTTNNTTTVTASSDDSSDEVVKASTPADNTTKILPQTGNQGVVSPVSFVVVLCAALAGAAVYLFAIRKKLN